jgi:hypothetical protein
LTKLVKLNLRLTLIIYMNQVQVLHILLQYYLHRLSLLNPKTKLYYDHIMNNIMKGTTLPISWWYWFLSHSYLKYGNNRTLLRLKSYVAWIQVQCQKPVLSMSTVTGYRISRKTKVRDGYFKNIQGNVFHKYSI